jgi:hypothetical protein
VEGGSRTVEGLLRLVHGDRIHTGLFLAFKYFVCTSTTDLPEGRTKSRMKAVASVASMEAAAQDIPGRRL